MKKIRPKTCKAKSCHNKFTPRNSTEQVCSWRCAVEYGKEKARDKEEKELRKDTRERKEKLETRSDWIKKAQKAVNEYVRIRDEKRPCISCSSSDGIGMANYWDAGHYRSRGSAPHLRFYTLNIWKQCKKCNMQLSGNIVEYRKSLVDFLGEAEVIRIESMQGNLKPSIEYLKRLTAIMRKKTRLYKRLFRNG